MNSPLNTKKKTSKEFMPPLIAALHPNQEAMLEITKQKLMVLGFNNFKVNLKNRIIFSVTNQGQSTEEM